MTLHYEEVQALRTGEKPLSRTQKTVFAFGLAAAMLATGYACEKAATSHPPAAPVPQTLDGWSAVSHLR